MKKWREDADRDVEMLFNNTDWKRSPCRVFEPMGLMQHLEVEGEGCILHYGTRMYLEKLYGNYNGPGECFSSCHDCINTLEYCFHSGQQLMIHLVLLPQKHHLCRHWTQVSLQTRRQKVPRGRCKTNLQSPKGNRCRTTRTSPRKRTKHTDGNPTKDARNPSVSCQTISAPSTSTNFYFNSENSTYTNITR